MVAFCSELDYASPSDVKSRPLRKVPLGDKFLFGLYRLATGLPLTVCAAAFGLADAQTGSRLFTALMAAWRQVLEKVVVCPSPEEIEQLVDIDSDDPDIRHIKFLLDTTEIRVQRSENLQLGVSARRPNCVV